ncbi:MAG: deoxyribose-phosphate aldolase [Bacteroidota bacterium]
MNLASYIDHTVLKADCNKQAIETLCNEALAHQFVAVCVPPYFVRTARKYLEDSAIKVATVIGFPMGYSAIPAKVEEIKRAIIDGVDELDVVVNICAVKNGDWAHVRNEVDSITRAAHLKGKIIKLIFETSLLDEKEMEQLCSLCSEIELDYVKTSTGFNGEGAKVETIKFLRSHLADRIKIKASGGIRSREDAEKMIEAGASRLGSSSGVKIVSS